MGILSIFKAKQPESTKVIKPYAGSTLYTPNTDPYYSEYDAAFRSTSYSCLKLRAEAMSCLKYQFYSKTSQNDKVELPLDHWIVTLFNRPNPEFRRKEIFRLLQYWLDLNGNAFVYAPLNGMPYPVQMWVLQSSSVRIIYGNDGIDHYSYNYQGMTYDFLPDEIIHFRTILPGTGQQKDHIGTSLVSLALDQIVADKELNNYLKRYLANDTVPPMVLEMPTGTEIADETADALRTQWASKLPKHKLVAVLQDGMKAVPLLAGGVAGGTTSMKDIDTILEKRIATIYGIPTSKLTGENTTFASAKLADWSFRMDTIEPLAQDICEAFTMHFEMFEPNILVDFEEFRYEDEDQEMKEREFKFKYGLTTINEERTEEGLLPVVGGDVVLIASGMVTLDSIINPPTIPAAPVATPAASIEPTPVPETPVAQSFQLKVLNKAWTDEQKLEYWQKYDKKLTENSKKMVKAMQPMFKDLEDIVLANFNKDNKKALSTTEGKKVIITKAVTANDLFSKKELTALISTYLTDDITEQILDAMKTASIDAKLAWATVETDLATQISALTRVSLDKIVVIEDSIKNNLANIFDNNPDASVGELSDLISESFVDYSGSNAWKADRIAQTTNTFTSNQGQKTVWNEYGIKYMWLTERDNKVRPEHAAVDGEVIGDNGIFSNGVDAPGNFGDAGLDINCRCVLMPVKNN